MAKFSYMPQQAKLVISWLLFDIYILQLKEFLSMNPSNFNSLVWRLFSSLKIQCKFKPLLRNVLRMYPIQHENETLRKEKNMSNYHISQYVAFENKRYRMDFPLKTGKGSVRKKESNGKRKKMSHGHKIGSWSRTVAKETTKDCNSWN